MRDKHDHTALVPMTHTDSMGFRFIDCIAECVTDDDPEEGYGEVPPVPYKHGEASPKFSTVSGRVGGAVECLLYPAQFGIPVSRKGECLMFKAGPAEILAACVKAVADERQAPEYMI